MERLGFRKQMKGAIGAIPVCGLITICLEVGLAFLHRGGSIEKHLIHFAILLLAAWGMVLLYGAVPSVRRIWKRIDREILSVDKRKPWVDIVYATLAMIMLLHHFYVLLYYPQLPAGASRFAPAWIPFAVITVLMGKLWKNKGFWICAVLAAYMFERTYLKDPNITGETMVYMVSMIYALVICYGVMNVIRLNYRCRILHILCVIWTLFTLSYISVGLYYAWTGVKIQNLGGGVTDVYGSRLMIFGTSNITAGTIAGGVLFAIIGFFSARNCICRFLYLIACFFILVANSLTDTRTSYLMISFALAGILTLWIWKMLKKHIKTRKWGNLLIAIGLSFSLIGCFLLALNGQQELKNQFVKIRDRDGLIVPVAQAETTVTTQNSITPPRKFADRDIFTDDLEKVDALLSGRKTIWETAYNYTTKNPNIIFFGLSADGSVRAAIKRDDHCHNIIIQFFMEGGILGVGLFLGLLGYYFYHACRLWRRWRLPMWQRALPIPVLAVLLMEMAECLTHFAYGHVPMTVLYFFIGATVAVSRSIGKKERKEDISTTTGITAEGVA